MGYSSFVGLRNFNVPPRKYRCCIRVESVRENGQAKLVLFIKGRQVEAPTEKSIGPFIPVTSGDISA
jgi:hypothetical protein